MSTRLLVPCLFAGLVFAACTGSSLQKREDPQLAQLRAGGLRIAVMPFQVTAPAEGFLESSLGVVGQLLALEPNSPSLPDRDRIGAITRNDVVTWLRQGSFEVVEPWVSDTQLAHAGTIDASDPEQAPAIARVLQVDAVLFGDLSRWNRSYYVVQSLAEVAVRLQLRDSSGRELFFGERAEQIGAGITGGPTGYGSVISQPVAGLKASNLRELLRTTARDAALDLNGSALGGEPSPLAPRLSFVAVQRLHDGPYGTGERIDVIAVGTPDCDVRFDLGRLRTGVPMTLLARTPDPRGERATYAGHYVVQPGDAAATLPVYCTIRRTAGKRSQLSRYRWDGEVQFSAAPK